MSDIVVVSLEGNVDECPVVGREQVDELFLFDD